MSLENVTRFWNWFDEAKGNLSVRQVEERAGCPRGRIGNPYSTRKEPTTQVCISIADGLGLSKEEVMRHAGILDPLPNDLDKRQQAELLEAMRRLTLEERKRVIEYVKFVESQRLVATEPGD